MIGARIRQARLLAKKSQQEVADALVDAGHPVSKARFIAYEKDRDMPDASTLLEMSRLFNVPPVWLMHKPNQEVDLQGYRRHSALRTKTRETIEAFVCDVTDLYIELRSQLYPCMKVNFPKSIDVVDFDGAEKAATMLRKQWQLGNAPISNLTHVAEENGVVVVDWDKNTEYFDGLSIWYGEDVPVIVTKCDVTADRKRFNLAHELGHLVMNTLEELTDRQTEKLAHRFAGALLVPESVAIQELKRCGARIGFSELGSLKKKYGLSMQGWVYRARDLGVIRPETAKKYWRKMNQRGWKKSEPCKFSVDERPALLKQMISTALDKDLVSPYRILQVFPGYKFESGLEAGVFPTATELLSMPVEERSRLTKISFALAAKEDFEIFEAFGEEI